MDASELLFSGTQLIYVVTILVDVYGHNVSSSKSQRAGSPLL